MNIDCHAGGDWPETPMQGACCTPSAIYGPTRCICWTPVHDLEQKPARTEEEHGARTSMCGDCAYRPKSPERAEDPDLLDDLVLSGKPFFCHDGLPRPTHYLHPSGMTHPADPSDYQPLLVDGRPYQVDGTPALYCGGWVRLANKAWESVPRRFIQGMSPFAGTPYEPKETR